MSNQEKRDKNRENFPNVAELIDAHREAFGDDFIIVGMVDYETKNRLTKKGYEPLKFPDEE